MGWEVQARTRALVIGAGIGGMQAALDIANAGYEVLLVERLPSIGGRMAQLSDTFPTLDCAQCILTPRTVEVGHHPHIHLHTYSEVEAIEGEMGDFRVCIRRRAAYVALQSRGPALPEVLIPVLDTDNQLYLRCSLTGRDWGPVERCNYPSMVRVALRHAINSYSAENEHVREARQGNHA